MGQESKSKRTEASTLSENDFNRSKAFLNSIVEHIPNMIFVKDARDLRFVRLNRAGEKLLGVKESKLLGKNDYDLFPKHQADFFTMKDRQVLAGAGVVEIQEESIRTANGEIRFLDTKKIPLFDENGEPEFLLGISEDVTERRKSREKLSDYVADLEQSKARIEQQARELLEARDKAEASTRAKGEFLANMSHEIRTPMNAILGMSSHLLESGLTDEQKDMARIVQRSASGLLTIIDDILDFSKIEAGKLSLSPSHFSLSRLIDELRSILELRLEAKNINLSIELTAEIPDQLFGDAGRLRQILLNLTGNALKFTPGGGSISLGCTLQERKGNELTLRFWVRDSGIGIPLEKQSLIFEPFTQADSTATRRFGGTGLGLSISSQLAELMGGKLMLASCPGEGSVFSFTCRLHASKKQDQIPLHALQKKPKNLSELGRSAHVLLAEDNRINQRLVVMLLHKYGYEVTVAKDGEEAFREWENGDFDVILMDIQMPKMDGVQTTAAIRKKELKLGKFRTPIIALTAHAMRGDRERYLNAGMDEYVSKPVRFDNLLLVIERMIEKTDAENHEFSQFASNH